MSLSKISVGADAPNKCNVIIEISMEAGPVKYEFDKETEMLTVDRIMPTTMQYPCNYGFIPNTLSGDGDPIDVLVHTSAPILPGACIKVTPIGVLLTEDESGEDSKILAVPAGKIDPFVGHITEYTELPQIIIGKIEHFFENYKKLEKNKWVKILRWESAEYAKKLILEAIERNK